MRFSFPNTRHLTTPSSYYNCSIMDFQGQRLAELIFYWIILSFGSVGWVIGYFQQDFTVVFQAWLVGVLLSVVLCVPDWPFYNRHPVNWLESVPDRRQHIKSS